MAMFLDKLFTRLGLLGNARLFNGRLGKILDANAFTGWWNNAFNAAPAFKWALSIVPLYGTLSGNPPVERIDFRQSCALAGTGLIWGYYSTLVTPRSNLLLAVSAALFMSNGYNAARRYKYDLEKEAKPSVSAGGPD
eukprot:TRINITY_DN9263_c0_g1_i1.p1 TRINITY_DN9263_c0_g1~~TRINITY_DN9263_c0_g1_i1.p1  ORF type:complete len:137 (+),score=27.56 TRINITY_DN9263_c0_g1_i1:662-1072(+)